MVIKVYFEAITNVSSLCANLLYGWCYLVQTWTCTLHLK